MFLSNLHNKIVKDKIRNRQTHMSMAILENTFATYRNGMIKITQGWGWRGYLYK